MGSEVINNIRDAVLPVFEKYKNKKLSLVIFSGPQHKKPHPRAMWI